jgi:DNA-binding SARP family transcriptional activator
MWIGLLGPLRVQFSDVPLYVAAAKQRSLLAALAVSPNDAIPAAVLAEVIWDARPPVSWQSTLRNYVRRLRLAVGSDVGARIVTWPPGYLLQAGRDEVDVLAFDALCRKGHAAARDSDWRRASGLLSSALNLWRGKPFVDIPSQPLKDAYLPYLEETRLAALVGRIEADLRISPFCGDGVIPELQRLCGAHPEQEHLRELLMLALYRCGRQADSFTVYREARQFSIAEMGVEPGPALREMHQRILRSDPALVTEQPWGRHHAPVR